MSSASPPRNFTLTSTERINALIAGPPAWALRKRRIEDLVDEIRRAEEVTTAIEKKLVLLNELIDKHNRYYPIEANLPLDTKTGRLMERGGTPWKPLERRTLESLRG